MKKALRLCVNGNAVSALVEPRTSLADFLRDHLLLTGTHIGCEHGVCGACTVVLDGAPARSCIAFAVACEGADVRTIEGFDDDATMAALRAAFTAEHALQCGYCTPGMLVTARDIVERLPDATEAEVRTELAGNLCRCTGYVGIVRAIERVLAERKRARDARMPHDMSAHSKNGPLAQKPPLLQRRGGTQSRSDRGRGGLPADRGGIDALLAVAPIWAGLVPAASVVALEGRWLLHAGPPLNDPRDPPAPILASAALACMYEGWAGSVDAAERAIREGHITLAPAQQQRCVTPLAALVSPSTSMVRVADRAGRVAPVHAPLATLGGPDLRFGTRDARILERLRLRDTDWTAVLRPAFAEPIDLIAIAAKGIAQGDDLHNRTTGATQALAECLGERLATLAQVERDRVDALMAALASTPLFFLTLWMAAAKLMLSAAEHGEPGTLITSMGGNGEVFGIALARNPQTWHTLPALAPQGAYLDPALTSLAPLGAIGDSAVIDALGFGGQALAFAPEPRAALAPYLPAGATPCSLLEAAHPAFARVGALVGMDAARIVKSPVLPVVTLGMVEKTGERGLLGRGVMLPPRELFVNAVRETS